MGEGGGELSRFTLTLDEAKAAYDRLLSQGVEQVSIQGGEPTLWPPLVDLITYGKQIGLREQLVVTNGRKLQDRALAERLAASGVDVLVLSIFGPNAAVHDASVGVPGAFEQLLAGARNLVGMRRAGVATPHITAQISVHAHNLASLPDTIRYWCDEGLDYFGVRLVRPTANTAQQGGERWFFDPADLAPKLELALDIALARGARVVFSEVFYCLLGPEYLGFVLADLPNTARLHPTKTFERRGGSGELHLVRRARGDPSCTACELQAYCSKLERGPLADRYTGQLTPIRVAETVQQLLSFGREFGSARRLAVLLRQKSALQSFGVPESLRGELRRKLLSVVAGSELLDEVLLSSPSEGKRLRERFSAAGGEKLVTRWVPCTELGVAGGSWYAGGNLQGGALPGLSPEHARFFAGLEQVFVDELFVVFRGRMKGSAGRPSFEFLVIVFDDQQCNPDQLRTLTGVRT